MQYKPRFHSFIQQIVIESFLHTRDYSDIWTISMKEHKPKFLFLWEGERDKTYRHNKQTISNMLGGGKYSSSVVSNHFGSRGWFLWRKFFHGLEAWEEGEWFLGDLSALHLLCTLFLLFSRELHLRSSGIRSQKLGTLAPEKNKVIQIKGRWVDGCHIQQAKQISPPLSQDLKEGRIKWTAGTKAPGWESLPGNFEKARKPCSWGRVR